MLNHSRKYYRSTSGFVLWVILLSFWGAVFFWYGFDPGWSIYLLEPPVFFILNLIALAPWSFDILERKSRIRLALATVIISGLWVLKSYSGLRQSQINFPVFCVLILGGFLLPILLIPLEKFMLRKQGIHPAGQGKTCGGELARYIKGIVVSFFFLFIGFFVYTVGRGIYERAEISEDGSIAIEVPDPDQELHENWDRYLTSRDPETRTRIAKAFELRTCPFVETGNWSQYYPPEQSGIFCGDVTVPLYHEAPWKGTIKIPIAIWPAADSGSASDALFITQGGPGGSTLDIYPDWLKNTWKSENRTLVFIDQRGTRYAQPSLVCTEEREWMDETTASSDGDDEQEYIQLLEECYQRLVNQGVDLNAFNTKQIAGDFEFVRQILGYSTIDFYGVSYGSHVGLYLAAYYPRGLRSLILDGLAPIPLDYLNRQLDSHTRILEVFEDSCKEDLQCGQEYPDLLSRLEAVVDRLNQHPVTVTFEDPGSQISFSDEMGGEDLLSMVLSTFYLDGSKAILPYLIQQAEHGNYDFFVWLGEMLAFEEVNASGLYYSVVCGEHSPLMDSVAGGVNRLTYLAAQEQEHMEQNREECAVWKVEPNPWRLDDMPAQDIPALLLSGYFDPVTPPSYGDQVLASFPHGQHIVDPVGSHGIAFTDDCTRSLVNQFLQAPDSTLDSACLSDPGRGLRLVPPQAISSPFLELFIEDGPWPYALLPVAGIMVLIMLDRAILLMYRLLKRAIKKRRSKLVMSEVLARLLFELSTWSFNLIIIGFSVGIIAIVFISPNEYLYAFAVPAEYRPVLLLSFLAVLILPAVLLASINLWRFSTDWKSRGYIVFQAGFAIGMTSLLGWLGLIPIGFG